MKPCPPWVKKARPGTPINKTQLKAGTRVEMEHTTDPRIARCIAMGHLEEYPKYYEFLKKMEMKLKKQKNK